MISLSPLFLAISTSCWVVSIFGTWPAWTLISCWAMFFSISEESNRQTMSPFLTLVPSGDELDDLVLVAGQLADAVDRDAALEVPALGDDHAQGGAMGGDGQRLLDVRDTDTHAPPAEVGQPERPAAATVADPGPG